MRTVPVMTRIGIVVNDEAREGFHGIHGISLYVETDDKYLLFDTGPSPEILENNADKMNIDIELIDAVVLSHIHTSHIGGVFGLGWASPYLDVYIPYGSMEDLGKRLESEGLRPHEVISDVDLGGGMVITRPLNGPPWEHFLLIEHDEGLVVLTGCMHPGLGRLLEYLKSLGRPLCCIIGGFHLSNAPDRIIDRYVSRLQRIKPRFVAPIHCSGERFRDRLQHALGEDRVKFLRAGEFIEL